jgi:hypothetical protein
MQLREYDQVLFGKLKCDVVGVAGAIDTPLDATFEEPQSADAFIYTYANEFRK